MIPLSEALESITPKNRPSIEKHLKAVNIKTWKDMDRWHLTRFATEVKDSMAASSAHTTFAVLKAFLGKFEREIKLPEDWRKILHCRDEKSMPTYLTPNEVEAFGEAYVDSHKERTVRDGFYLSCKTGLRHSDLVKLLPSNFQPREGGGWLLTYVSKKTRITSSVICSDATKEKAEWLHKNGVPVPLDYYNDMVRTLAQRADINTEVSVFERGEEMSGPKWKFLKSHSARRTFCTICADLGADVLDIMRMAGHTNPAMTARYIVRHEVKVNPKVEQFLM